MIADHDRHDREFQASLHGASLTTPGGTSVGPAASRRARLIDKIKQRGR